MTIELDEAAKKYIERQAQLNPGIPAERFIAFTIPSLVNKVRVPANGAKASLTSRLKDTSSHVRWDCFNVNAA